MKIAQQITGDHVVDLFCGVGGNSIGFAKKGKFVKSVDLSKSRLKMAHLNAEKFGVENNIEFIHMDVLDFLSNLKMVDTIFLDPPWGGNKHRFFKKFCFKEFPVDVEYILWQCLKLAKHIIIKLPFNFDVDELSRFNEQIKITQHCLPIYTTKRPIMLTAHFVI